MRKKRTVADLGKEVARVVALEDAVRALQRIADHARAALDGNVGMWRYDLQTINDIARSEIDSLTRKGKP